MRARGLFFCRISELADFIWLDDPLDLSISVRGGEETNEDSLSSGE